MLKTKHLRFLVGSALLLLCLSTALSAQKNKFNLVSDQRNTVPEYLKLQGGLQSSIAFTLAYQHLSFMNTNYLDMLQDKTVQYKWGVDLRANYLAYPFRVSFGMSLGRFNVDSETFYEGQSKQVKVNQYNAFCDIFPMPQIWKISYFLRPYFGLGYNYTGLYALEATSENSSKEASTLGSLEFGSPMYRIGALIQINDKLGLFYEYRQAFSFPNSRYQQVARFAGISYNL